MKYEKTKTEINTDLYLFEHEGLSCSLHCDYKSDDKRCFTGKINHSKFEQQFTVSEILAQNDEPVMVEWIASELVERYKKALA